MFVLNLYTVPYYLPKIVLYVVIKVYSDCNWPSVIPGPIKAKFKYPLKKFAAVFPAPLAAAHEFIAPRYQTGDGESDVVDIIAGPLIAFPALFWM